MNINDKLAGIDKNDWMTAILYMRNSPGRKESKSCEAQYTILEDSCVRKKMAVEAHYKDKDLTGKNTRRPGLKAAMDHACRIKGVLVVYSLSRLSRSLADAIKLMGRLDAAGADLISITENIDTTSPIGRFVFHLMAALAQLEREQISERTRDALAAYRAQGRRTTSLKRIPYGYRVDERDNTLIVEDEMELEIMAEAYFRQHFHHNSLRKIAADLTNIGYRSRSPDGILNYSVVNRMIGAHIARIKDKNKKYLTSPGGVL